MFIRLLSLLSGLALLACSHVSVLAQNIVRPPFELEPVPYFLSPAHDGNIIMPTGVAVNAEGHVFVFNKGNKQLMEFDASGNYIQSMGAGLFADPHGLRIDSDGNIWTTDLDGHMVMKLNQEGQVLMVLGQRNTSGFIDTTRNMVLFNRPADVAFGRNGEIYVADGYGNHRIVHLDRDGNLIRTWGEQGPEEGNFDNPHNIVYRQGRVYVADRYNDRIQVFNSQGEFQEAWTDIGNPWGLAVSPEGYIYMTDGANERIIKFELDGTIVGSYEAGGGTAQGQLRAAHGIAVGPQEELFVTEVMNWRVQKFQQRWQMGDWERLATNGDASHRHEAAFIEVNGKFYAMGGRNIHGVDIYDPTTNTWTKGAPSPLELHHFQAVAYEDEIWVIGALTGPYPKEEPVRFLYAYNTKTDTWRVSGKLPEGRERGNTGVVLYDNKFYMLCGNLLGHHSGHRPWFDVLDPTTGEWSTLADAPHTRDHFHAVVIDDKLFAAGGRNTSQSTGHVLDQLIPEVDVYDFKTQKWSVLDSNLPTPRGGTTAFNWNDNLVVLGGETHLQVPAHQEVEMYELSAERWSRISTMLQGRHGTSVILYNGKMYIAGGASSRGGGPELKSIDVWHLDKK